MFMLNCWFVYVLFFVVLEIEGCLKGILLSLELFLGFGGIYLFG